MKLFKACFAVAFLFSYTLVQSQDLLISQDDYDFPMSWNKVFHIPLDVNGNPFWLSNSSGEVRVENGTVVFDDASCGKAEKRVWRPLGHFLGDEWTSRITFTPTQGLAANDTRTGAIILALTAGTKDAHNDLAEPVDASSGEFSDQDGIFVSLLSPNSSTGSIYLELMAKDGTTRYRSSTGSGTIGISYGNTYYVELKRVSSTAAELRVFSDPGFQTAVGSTLTLTIPSTIKGLSVVQHGTIPAGGWTRHLTATIDDFELLETSGACLECDKIVTDISTNRNRVRTEVARVAVQTKAEFDALSNGGDKIEQVQYFDGLGRSKQAILINGTVDCNDIISFREYDDLGRTPKQYLPYIQSATEGEWQSNTITDQETFYSSTNFPEIPSTDLDVPFAITQFDGSPLNRAVEQGFQGTDWQPESISTSFGTQTANEHTQIASYGSNEVLDQIFQFPIDIAVSTSTLYDDIYPSDELYVTTGIDENGSVSSVFTDKRGQTICLEKSVNVHIKIRTYYLYDSKGRPIYVLQPEGEEAFRSQEYGGQFKWTQELVDDYCFQYRYDTRGRLVEKKVPGADWVYIVYDQSDKPVATQDGNQRATSPSTWLITKYDALGRVILTGEYKPSSTFTRTYMQAIVDGSGTTFDLFETRENLSVDDKTGQPIKGYSNGSFPDLANVEVHSVIYFDSYDYDQNGVDDVFYTVDVEHFPNNGADYRVRGKVTGVKERVLSPENGMPVWLLTTTFYDTRGREIQTVSENHLNGADTADFAYTFVGERIASRVKHVATDAASGVYTKSLTTWNFYSYDHSGRLLHVEQRTSDPLSEEKETETEVIVRNEYNSVGQVIQKNLHQDVEDSDFWQSVDYSYNIRGWLSRMNQFSAATGGTSGDLFSMSLSYNDFGSDRQYNGNISFVQWQVDPDNHPLWSAYDISYDGLNRITSADYLETIDLLGSGYTHNVGNYDLSISYDLNGNITSLQRNGRGALTNSAVNDWEKTYASFSLDDLSYDYSSAGNQLQSVDDAATTNQTAAYTQFLDGTNSGNDYDYDANGNMIKDLNKGIVTIEYNHFNKPTLVQFNDYKKITYTYSASGKKLRQSVYHPVGSFDPPASYSLEKQSDYINGVHYEDGDGEATSQDLHIVFALHFEGRFRPDGEEMIYEYFLKDHQGNTRVTFSDLDNDGEAEILQENHYYPFGMAMTYPGTSVSAPPTLYQYNGKELQDELDLGWYDYGARMYDASIGKWNGVDPLAELYLSSSPYAYVMNNPLNLIDPTGMSAEGVEGANNPNAVAISGTASKVQGQTGFVKPAHPGFYTNNNSGLSGGAFSGGYSNSNRDVGTGASLGPNSYISKNLNFGNEGDENKWINNGDGTYTAMKGAGAWGLAREAGIAPQEAINKLREQGFPLYRENGIDKVAINPGETVRIFEAQEPIEEAISEYGYTSFDEWSRENNKGLADIVDGGVEGVIWGIGVEITVYSMRFTRNILDPRVIVITFTAGMIKEIHDELQEWSNSLTPEEQEERRRNRESAYRMLDEYKPGWE